MIMILSALMLVMAGIVSYSITKVRFNAATITVSAWLIVLILCALPGAIDPALAPDTQRIFFWVGLCSLGFSAGWSIFRGSSSPKTILISRNSLSKFHAILLILLTFSVLFDILQMYPLIQQLGGFKALWEGSGGGATFRLASLQQRQDDIAGGLNLTTGFISYLGAPGLMSFVTGALLWKDKKFIRAMFPLVIAACHGVILVERTSFILGLLLFLLTLGLLQVVQTRFIGEQIGRRSRGETSQRLKKYIVVIVICSVLTAALAVPLIARNSGTTRSTGVYSLLQYLMSSVEGLNSHIVDNTAFVTNVDPATAVMGVYPGLGGYTFYGIFGLLRRFGLLLAPTPPIINYDNVIIFGDQFSTNTRTMIWTLHMDFGPVGGLVALFLLFLLCGLLGRAVKNGSIRWVGMYSTLGGSLAWSFFGGGGMLADFRYVFAAVLSLWILGRLAPREEADAQPPELLQSTSTRH